MSKANERAERAAAAVREQRRREQRRNRLTIVGVVAVIALIVGGGFAINRFRAGDDAVDAPEAGAGASTDAGSGSAAAAATDFGVTVGDESAPHSIVIYEDFVCPYCGELEKASHEKLADLAGQGKVYVEYRPFDLLRRDYSVDAANAFKVTLDAAGPVVGKKLHDILYADQPDETGPFPDADWYVDRAVEAGATEADVRPGIEGGSQLDWVRKATAAASAAGVNSTPTVLLDGKQFTRGTSIDDIVDNLVDAVD